MYHNDTSLRGSRILNEINIKIPGENNRLLLLFRLLIMLKIWVGRKCDSVSRRVSVVRSEEKSRGGTRLLTVMCKGHRNVNSPLSVAYGNCVQIKWVFTATASPGKSVAHRRRHPDIFSVCSLQKERAIRHAGASWLITRLNGKQSNYGTPIMDIIFAHLNRPLVAAYRIINVRDPSGIGTT